MEKKPAGKADSYWKPSFSGAMLVSGRVAVHPLKSMVGPWNLLGCMAILWVNVICFEMVTVSIKLTMLTLLNTWNRDLFSREKGDEVTGHKLFITKDFRCKIVTLNVYGRGFSQPPPGRFWCQFFSSFFRRFFSPPTKISWSRKLSDVWNLISFI